MPKNAYSIGQLWEGLTANFLQDKGFQIIAKRYKATVGEIDIIFTIPGQNVIVFCEIKYRKAIQDFTGIISVAKFNRIFATSQIFLEKHPEFAQFNPRFDFIFVQKDGRIDHIENISF